MICPDCNGNGEAIYYEYLGTDFAKNTVNIKPKKDICRTCNGSGHITQTHADYIRAMSDEELAKWIDWLFGRCEWCDTDKMAADECNDVECTPCILEWLKQPAEE